MSRAQRVTLGVLGVFVMLAAAGAVVVAVSAPGTTDAAASTTTEPSPSTTAPSTTTSTDATTTTTTEVTTTTSEPASTTTSTEPPERVLVLRPDGIDGAYFGDDASQVLDALTTVLGSPDSDTGWVDQMANYGTCLGDTVRFVQWGSLRVFFTDGPSDWAPAGVRHLASYTQSGALSDHVLDLVTSDGLSLGSPVGDIRALYGDDAVVDDPAYGPLFVYDPPGFGYQWGEVTGTAAEDTILSIVGGFACGE